MYFLVNLSCLHVLSCKFISRITLTFRFNLTSHAKYIVLCGVFHLDTLAARGLEELFPVVLLCQFLVLAGNRF